MQGHVAYQVNPAFLRLYPPEFPAGDRRFSQGAAGLSFFSPKKTPSSLRTLMEGKICPISH
jgi:hypothetical protein